jgi:hypothetical protein
MHEVIICRSATICVGECKTKMLESPAMARRPERNEEVVLTRAELKELQKRLASYQRPALESFYRAPTTDVRCSRAGFLVPKRCRNS